MSKEYEYKGHKITFNERGADFSCTINGRNVRSTSLEGMKRQIEKYAIAEFKPVDVAIIARDKKGKRVVKVTRLESYQERKPYGTRDLERTVVTKEGESFDLTGGWRVRGRIFKIDNHDKAKELVKELEKQEAIKEKASSAIYKIENELKEMTLDLASIDPRSSKS